MVCKPFGQCININIWVFLSFLLASLKNLSKNKKMVPFPGKRAIVVTVYGVCVRQAHTPAVLTLSLSVTPENVCSASTGPPPELPFWGQMATRTVWL